MNLKNFTATLFPLFNPLRKLTQALAEGKSATSLKLIHLIKGKKVNNILFNELLSLPLLKEKKK